ncbi:MAG: hypothetical protein K8S25_06390 [Alphaproteobacteria bacterium]|nr:hypothetical protein [Alphaproteobacteria bacterium]
MATNSLEKFSENVKRSWGSISSELVAEARLQMETLLRASPKENWLANLHKSAAPREELYRDPDQGFVLLAHTEHAGLYRPPHDHGRSWVTYGIQEGEIEMGAYVRVDDGRGRVRLVQRDSTVLRPGQARSYLPGDIHDTRCLTDTALLFRFSDRDLKIEDELQHRVTRYMREDGVWVPPAL